MTDNIKSWIKDHYILGGILVTMMGWLLLLQREKVELQARVVTLEIRGSPHLEKIDTRLTVLEGETHANKDAIISGQRELRNSIDKIIEIMTRELGKPIPKQ